MDPSVPTRLQTTVPRPTQVDGREKRTIRSRRPAAGSSEQLVIYRVSCWQDAAMLTSQRRPLLSGENKFAIVGGEADPFLINLMAVPRIGQPDLVFDPIGELRWHRVDLVASEAV